MMVALAMTASATINAADLSSDLPGLGAWGVGLVWVLLGWGGLLASRRLPLVLGSGTAVVGA